MSRNRKPNLKRQMENALYNKWQKGKNTSRHDLKAEDRADRVISSNNTFRSYKQAVGRFAEYMKQEHPKIKSMNEAQRYVGEYLKSLQMAEKSPRTVKSYACALGKVYECSTSDFGVKFEACRRADITNNRGTKESHKHINEAHFKEATDLIDKCGARHSELKKVSSEPSDKRHGIFGMKQEKDGTIYVGIRGKGGKERWAEYLGSVDEANKLYKDWSTTKDGEDIYRAPKALPTHRHRQNYAEGIYNKYARDLKGLNERELYRCRNELAGVVYDRKALYKVQQNLGHNNLHCVTNYVFA